MSSTKTNSLLQGIKTVNNFKSTENGALALQSTFSAPLDLFGEIGALRERSEQDIINLFLKAYAVDRLLALKILFYARDVRGGLGERNTFKVILKYLAHTYTDDVIANINIIPEYGRWDDIFCLFDTPAESAAMKVIATQFYTDVTELAQATAQHRDAAVSLLGKWLPSENASSYKTKALAKRVYTTLNLSPKDYRRTLTKLRAAIKIVEAKMSKNDWQSIDYSQVPSVASLRYRDAFLRHDEERYSTFINKVEHGEAKINAATLYPYDLVRNYISQGWGAPSKPDATVEAQWKALPNYLDGATNDFLIMADTSGSMFCNNDTPISTSVGLAIYFAERSKGAFANNFITFTDVPELREIPPHLSLKDKIDLVLQGDGYDTNLEAAFDLVLKAAISNNVPPEDMPSAIVIISDMEINQFGDGDDNLNFTETMARKFAAAGYIMPTLVYWNVNARQDTFHATADDNVRFVSGSSPAVFKGLCEHLGYSAIELMLAVINAPRYDAVKLG